MLITKQDSAQSMTQRKLRLSGKQGSVILYNAQLMLNNANMTLLSNAALTLLRLANFA